VILESSGPRVIDFGIARAAEGSDLTRTGALIGTPGFMSPEQTRSQPLTAASDVFSLGSVLVLACTGTGPFSGASTLDTMNNVVRAAPDLSGVPARVRALATRCLAPDPADRPTPAGLLDLIGPLAPSSRPWPEAIASLEDEQQRRIALLLDGVEEHPTRVDTGPTMVTDPHRPTWVRPPEPGPPTTPPVRSTPPPAPRPTPPVRPASDPNTQAHMGAGAAIVLVCAVIAGLVWYADRDSEVEEPSSDYTDSETYEDTWTTSEPGEHEVYVQECVWDGYDEAECEVSWGSDPSYTWTGQLYGGGPSERDVYLDECAADGYSDEECESSWYADPSYTWTGELF